MFCGILKAPVVILPESFRGKHGAQRKSPVRPRWGTSFLEANVRCPYCEEKIKLVTGDTIYPLRPDLHHKLFWYCRPCNAYVGCHASGKGTSPLGRLANAELRAARMVAHAAFDPLWKEGHMRRAQAYRWLADKLQLPVKKCHISWLELEQCKRVPGICETFTPPEPDEITLRFEHAIAE